MLFLFDLDDTLVSGDIVSDTSAKLLSKGLVDRLYTNLDVKNYDLRDLPPLLRARTTQTFGDPAHVWKKYPIAGSFYFLQTLEASAHQTGIVTARPLSVEEETRRFLIARFPGIRFELGVQFVNKDSCSNMEDMPSKMEYLKKVGADYFFDDNADYCTQAKSIGIKTYLISNKYTPWNHDFAEEQKTILDPVQVLRNVAFFPETSI